MGRTTQKVRQENPCPVSGGLEHMTGSFEDRKVIVHTRRAGYLGRPV